jgi:hypothetical protein
MRGPTTISRALNLIPIERFMIEAFRTILSFRFNFKNILSIIDLEIELYSYKSVSIISLIKPNFWRLIANL